MADPVEESAEGLDAENAKQEAAEEAAVDEEAGADAAANSAEEPAHEDFIEVPRRLLEWLTGLCEEVARESGVEVLLPEPSTLEADPAAETAQVKIVGESSKIEQAKASIEEQLRNAPVEGKEKEETEPQTPAKEADDNRSTSCTIAGRTFDNQDDLNNHVRKLQSGSKGASMLGPEDSFFLFHLATHHPQFNEKMTSPIVGITYGDANRRTFTIVRADGSEESISARKCVEGACRKRSREDADLEDGEASTKWLRREMQAGCVVIIDGVPNDIKYGDMRELLASYGHIKYLEFMRDAVKAGGAGTDGAATDAMEGDDAADPEAAAADGNEAVKEEEGVKEEDDKDANMDEVKEEGDGNVEVKEEEAATVGKDGAADEGQGAHIVSVKARFGNEASAKKCADECVLIQGLPVSARVLEGEEEKAFWEDLWKVAEKTSKGKGKKDRNAARNGGRGRDRRSRERRDRSRDRDRRDDRRGRERRSRDRRSRDRRAGKGKGKRR